MWFKTKEGLTVFTVKHKGNFYQLNNDTPEVGDYCMVDLEHDPRYIVRVRSFNPAEYYSLNKDCRYGGWPCLRDHEIDFYGVCKITWTDNPNLEINYQRDRIQQFAYWSKQQPHLTLEDF